jgi:hypothetical protein
MMLDSFGNKVRIKDAPLTKEKGLAGKVGEVYGQTTPSVVDVEIIGTPSEDIAVNVYFDDLKISYWFDRDLLETISDGQGTVITLDGIDKKWTKGQSEQWIEENIKSIKKWWEFWK